MVVHLLILFARLYLLRKVRVNEVRADTVLAVVNSWVLIPRPSP